MSGRAHVVITPDERKAWGLAIRLDGVDITELLACDGIKIEWAADGGLPLPTVTLKLASHLVDLDVDLPDVLTVLASDDAEAIA